MRTFEKRRVPAKAGSIPEALDMFRAEVRFYREIAPVVGVRVPVCITAEDTSEGTRLLLEDPRPGRQEPIRCRWLASWRRFTGAGRAAP